MGHLSVPSFKNAPHNVHISRSVFSSVYSISAISSRSNTFIRVSFALMMSFSPSFSPGSISMAPSSKVKLHRGHFFSPSSHIRPQLLHNLISPPRESALIVLADNSNSLSSASSISLSSSSRSESSTSGSSEKSSSMISNSDSSDVSSISGSLSSSSDVSSSISLGGVSGISTSSEKEKPQKVHVSETSLTKDPQLVHR